MQDKSGVSETENYIIRRYDGIRSVQDMKRINNITAEAAKKFVKLKKPVRILLDLRGSFDASIEIYGEAVKILDLFEIDKIASIQPPDFKIEILMKNTRDNYKSSIEFREFDNEPDARDWLNIA